MRGRITTLAKNLEAEPKKKRCLPQAAAVVGGSTVIRMNWKAELGGRR